MIWFMFLDDHYAEDRWDMGLAKWRQGVKFWECQHCPGEMAEVSANVMKTKVYRISLVYLYIYNI